MSNARVIKLVPVETPSVSFEDAFGEYSEARGRRAERKAKRQEARQERKEGRQEARQERKAETGRKRRKTTRQEARLQRKATRQDRRTGRQEARQDRKSRRIDLREERQGARQERRTMRTAGKVARKGGLEQGLDVEMPEVATGTGFEQQQYTQPETTQTYGDETQGTYDQGAVEQGGGYTDQGSDYGYEQEGGAPYGDEQDATYGGQGGYYGDEEGTSEDGGYYGEEDAQSGEGEYDEEGDYIGEESGYLADYDASGDNFDGKAVDVDPNIQDAVDKLAWNAECVKRLEAKRKLMPNKAQAISKKMIEHKKRFNELKSSLDDYANCCGDYSSADGVEPQRRRMMVRKAWGVSKAKIRNAGKPMPTFKRPADDLIPVASDLNPTFSPNRIVVPNKMVSNATGLNGLDLQDDFDAPRVREVFLGADGSKTNISWGSVLLGVGVGVAAVWAIKKYKLIK